VFSPNVDWEKEWSDLPNFTLSEMWLSKETILDLVRTLVRIEPNERHAKHNFTMVRGMWFNGLVYSFTGGKYKICGTLHIKKTEENEPNKSLQFEYRYYPLDI
jgi:hypothetical protein